MYTDIRLFTEGDFLTFRSLDGLLLGGTFVWRHRCGIGGGRAVGNRCGGA
jgi:hypothetical protein